MISFISKFFVIHEIFPKLCDESSKCRKEIVAHLFLSQGTVRNVLSVIMDKLNVKNRTQLTLLMKES